MSIGQRIKLARKKAAITQRTLGGERYSASYVSQIENDQINPSIKALRYMAERLNRPLTYFCAEPGETEKIAERRDTEKLAEFLLNLAEGHLAVGRADLAKTEIERARALVPTVESETLRALLRRLEGKLKGAEHDWDAAEDLYREAAELFRAMGLGSEVARTYVEMARLYFDQDLYKKAETFFRRAAEAAQGEEDPALLGDINKGLGVVLSVGGKLDDAKELLEKALESGEKAADPAQLADIYLDLGLNARDRGELDRALQFSRKAVAMFENLDHQRSQAEALGNMGMVRADRGEYDKAKKAFEASIEILRALNDNKVIARVTTELAKVHLAAGDLDAAEAEAERALAVSQEYLNRAEKARLLSLLGEVAQKRRDWNKAKKYFKQSIDLFEEVELPVEVTEVLRKYSQLLLNTGETEEAAASLGKAIEKLGKR